MHFQGRPLCQTSFLLPSENGSTLKGKHLLPIWEQMLSCLSRPLFRRVLLFVALWFILRGDLLYVFPCVILFLGFFFSPFSIAITSLGEERANLSAFRTFVRFVLV